MKKSVIYTGIIYLIISLNLSVFSGTVWDDDKNGYLYVLRGVGKNTEVIEVDKNNNRRVLKAPYTLSIAVNPLGKIFTARTYLYRSGRKVGIKVYKESRALWSVPACSASHLKYLKVDLAVSQNTTKGDRVYLLVNDLGGGKRTIYYNGNIYNWAGEKKAGRFYGTLSLKSTTILVNSYSKDYDYVQVRDTAKYRLQALWQPLSGAGGTTGYLYQMFDQTVKRAFDPVSIPTVPVINFKKARLNAFADAIEYYRIMYNHNLSFVVNNQSSGNQTIYNLLDEPNKGNLTWATLGNHSKTLIHIAAKNVLSGTKLIIYEPILKLNRNAILEGEIKDSNGDNIDDYGYDRDDYEIVGLIKHEFPLTGKDASHVFKFTGQRGGKWNVRVGHLYRGDPDYKGENGQFLYDKAKTENQIYSMQTYKCWNNQPTNKNHVLNTALQGIDEVYIYIEPKTSSWPDQGNLVAVELVDSTYSEAEYFSVSGSDQNASSTPDMNGNITGDVYTLRRTYDHFKYKGVVPRNWPDSITNTNLPFPTRGYGLKWTLRKDRGTNYNLFRDSDKLNQSFPIGDSTFYQDAATVNCGCRGIEMSPYRMIKAAPDPVKDFAVINIGLPPKVIGNNLCDIKAKTVTLNGRKVLYLDLEDKALKDKTGAEICFENYDVPVGTNIDVDGDGRAGGFSSAVYYNRGAVNDPNNPVFKWYVKRLKPTKSTWKYICNGPVFKPAASTNFDLFYDGGEYRIRLEVSFKEYNYTSLTYPPFYWQVKFNSITPSSHPNICRNEIDVVVVAKAPNSDIGDLAVKIMKPKIEPAYSALPLKFQDFAKYNNPVTKKEDVVITFRAALYENGLKRGMTGWGPRGTERSSIRFAPPALKDNPITGNVTTATVDKFAGILFDANHPIIYSWQVTPTFNTQGNPTLSSFSYYTVYTPKTSGGIVVRDGKGNVVYNSSKGLVAGYHVNGRLVPETVKMDKIFRSYLQPSPNIPNYLSTNPNEKFAGIPDLRIAFNTPILPDEYKVRVEITYYVMEWDPVYSNTGKIISYKPKAGYPLKKKAVDTIKVRVKDITAPYVKLLGGTNNAGDFLNIKGANDKYLVTSGATTGDPFFPKGMRAVGRKILCQVIDNNPNFDPAKDFQAYFVYENPKEVRTDTGKKYTIIKMNPLTKTCLAPNPADPTKYIACQSPKDDNYKYLSSQYKSAYTFGIADETNIIYMPGDETVAYYYIAGCDTNGNGIEWSTGWGYGVPVAFGSGGTAAPSDIDLNTPGIQWTYPSTVKKPEGSGEEGIARGRIEILDNDPPSLFFSISGLFTSSKGEDKFAYNFNVTSPSEPDISNNNFDVTSFTNLLALPDITNPDITGFNLKFEKLIESGSTTNSQVVYQSTSLEKDGYVNTNPGLYPSKDPSNADNQWLIDMDSTDATLPYSKVQLKNDLPLLLMGKTRLKLSVSGVDNIDGNLVLNWYEPDKALSYSTGSAIYNCKITLVDTSGNESDIEKASVPISLFKDTSGNRYVIFRKPFTGALVITLSDSAGNRRLLKIPVKIVSGGTIMVQTLESRMSTR